ncbi:MAG: tRNA (guanosine(46)-N7)-methyltransferase TrmB [Bdellovibrionota bacterium]|nr:tRNA (guanosine(46)-N7)-methyltransferase TrmB [Bdellovibrionota bacterium]
MEQLIDQNTYFPHDNPYHEKLKSFDNFVLRDEEGEAFRGNWNKNAFKNQGPLVLEIGSGYGHFMMDFCSHYPEINFVGMDYKFKRSFQLAQKLKNLERKNFFFLRANGARVDRLFAESELDQVFYFFPDPWPKNKHKKKRLFQKNFLKQVHSVLKPQGKFFIKTDHSDYAEWMKALLLECPFFKIETVSFDIRQEYPEHFLSSFQTKFEKIFLKQDIPIKGFELTCLKEGP